MPRHKTSKFGNDAKDTAALATSLAESMNKLEINYPYLTNFFKALNKGNATIVFLGDSTTEANTTNNNYPHPAYLQDWFNTKYGVGKVTVINSGVSGNDLSLMCDRVAKDVINKNPDVVIICSGWNDTNLGTLDIFEYRYNTIIELIKVGSTKPLDIILRTPNYSTNSDAMVIMDNQVIPLTEKVAKRNNVGLVDYFYQAKQQYNKGLLILDPTLPNTTQADLTHPNQQGQALIGDFLKPMFDINGNIGKLLNGVANNYKGLYIESTDTSLVTNNGYAIATTEEGNIRYKRLASNGSFPNKTATLKFYGSYVKVVVKVGKDQGQISIAIDGGTATTYDLYENQRNSVGVQNFKIIEINGLTNAEHTVVVTNLSTQNPSSTGSSVLIQGFIVDEISFYAYKFKNQLTTSKYEAIVRYNSADSATKTTTVAPNASVLVEFDYVILNDATQFIPISDKACTVSQAGLYMIDGSITIANATNRGILQILKNGGYLSQQSFNFDNVAAGNRNIKVSTITRLAVGDKITLQAVNAYNSDPITINTYNVPAQTGMKVFLIGN